MVPVNPAKRSQTCERSPNVNHRKLDLRAVSSIARSSYMHTIINLSNVLQCNAWSQGELLPLTHAADKANSFSPPDADCHSSRRFIPHTAAKSISHSYRRQSHLPLISPPKPSPFLHRTPNPLLHMVNCCSRLLTRGHSVFVSFSISASI